MNLVLTAVLILLAFQPATDWVTSSALAHHLIASSVGAAKTADASAVMRVWPVIFFLACYGSATAVLAPLRSLLAGRRKPPLPRIAAQPGRPVRRAGK